jgi:uncharacterized protein YdhG (YjbR/CyaY superfamily)
LKWRKTPLDAGKKRIEQNIVITVSGIEAFKQELSEYKGGKGSFQFPIEHPLPYELIRRIVTFRIVENRNKAEIKKSK